MGKRGLRSIVLTSIFLPVLMSRREGLPTAQTAATGISATDADLRESLHLIQRKDYLNAQKRLTHFVETHAQSAEAFFYLGVADQHLGMASEAEKALRRSLELNPQSANTLYNLGVLLLDLKRPREAIPYLVRARQTGPDSPEFSVNLVRGYLDADLPDEASKIADSAVRRYPNEPAVYLALGKTLLSHGRAAESLSYLRGADHLMPSQPEVLVPMAGALLQQREPAEALEALERIPQGSGDFAECHYFKAQAYFALQRKDQAFQQIRAATERSPQNALYWLTLGRYEQKYGKQREAVATLEKAERLAPDLPEIPYSIAVSYFIGDDFELASKYVDRALEIDSAFARAVFLKGISHFALGKFGESEALLSRALGLEPRNPFYYCFYGMVLASENRDPEARAALEEALSLEPSYALAHYHLGRLLARSGDYSKARVELEKATALQPDLAEAFYQLAHTYRRLGENAKADQALATFRKYRAEEFSERQQILKGVQEVVRGEP
jgi:tetratricopeptide (TPR) repeat protein